MNDTVEQKPIKVLVVDDDVEVLRALRVLFSSARGFSCLTTEDARMAADLAKAEDPDVILTDVRMPRLDGLELLSQLKANCPGCEVVLMTGFASVPTAVKAVKAGACDFLLKPLEDLSVELAVLHAAERKRLRARTERLDAELGAGSVFEGLVGRAPAIRKVCRLIEAVAPSDASVLIVGESGTGKELVAHALHVRSPRKDEPFLAVNCSALPAGLAESELFGHVRGAFTGALTDKKGFFETAHRGTLFLDEVTDLSPTVQVQLLRALQEGEVRRIGSNEVIKIDVRIVAATNLDLDRARADGKFREDLYYRLNVISIHLPPLRARSEDIATLARYFLRKHSQRANKPVPDLDPEALALLNAHPWPGNVRELDNAMERATLLAPASTITPAELPPAIAGAADRPAPDAHVFAELPYLEAKLRAVRMFERRYLGAMMRRSNGSIADAARNAGLDRSNFRRLLRVHGVDHTGAGSLDPASAPQGSEGDPAE